MGNKPRAKEAKIYNKGKIISLANGVGKTFASYRKKNKTGLHVKSLQSCLTLCDPKDCSLPGSSVNGILLTRVLE